MTSFDALAFIFIGLMTVLILMIWWLNKIPRSRRRSGGEASFTEPKYDRGGPLPMGRPVVVNNTGHPIEIIYEYDPPR